MHCYLIHCRDYKAVCRVVVSSFTELPALCRAAEITANDGYAVYARHDRRIVADADGVTGQRDDGREYRDAIDRACGYLD